MVLIHYWGASYMHGKSDAKFLWMNWNTRIAMANIKDRMRNFGEWDILYSVYYVWWEINEIIMTPRKTQKPHYLPRPWEVFYTGASMNLKSLVMEIKKKKNLVMALLFSPELVVCRMTNSLSFSTLHPRKQFSFRQTQSCSPTLILDSYRT